MANNTNKNSSKKSAAASERGAYLFVDDDERIVRFRLGAGRVSIGRSQNNDIWVEHPEVSQQSLVIVRRDGHDVMKVFDGALVRLNGVGVTKMHRLYGGDHIQVGDRDFLYARDDSVPDYALGLTLFDGEDPVRAVVMRQTRIRIGRRDADVVIDDPSVSERHLRIEAYANDGLFVCDLGSAMGTSIGTHRVEGRARLADGSLLRVGRVLIAVHILDADAYGLLCVPEAPRERPKAVDTPIGARSYNIDAARAERLDSEGGYMDEPLLLLDEEVSSAPHTPPPTVIGSLAHLAEAELSDSARGPMKPQRPPPRRTKKRQRPSAKRSDSWRPANAPVDRPISGAFSASSKSSAPVASKQKSLPTEAGAGPSMRISPDIYERGRQRQLGEQSAVDGPRRPREEPPRRYGAGRMSRDSSQSAVAASSQRRAALHEKLTDVLDTNSVRDMAGERYVAAYQNVEPAHPERNLRYRPSKPGGARVLTDQKLVAGNRRGHVDDPFGVHRQVTVAGDIRSLDKLKLTGMLDLVADKPRLDRERHELDPDAMPEQLREQWEGEESRSRRGPIDGSSRRQSRQFIDNSRRPENDED